MKRKVLRVELTEQGSTFPPVPNHVEILEDGVVRIEPPPVDQRNRAYHVPTPYTRRQAELLTAYGLNQDEIAHIIGVSPNTLKAHYERELKFGASKLRARAAHRLHDIMLYGTGKEALTALIFYLKTKGGFVEPAGQLNVNHTGTVNHEHVALTHEERAARILQVLNAGAAGGAGSAIAERIRTLVAQSGASDARVLQSGG